MSLIDERFLKIVEAVEGMEKCVSCAICLETAKSPVETRCGHTFCTNCIHKVLCEQGKSCPLCKTALTRRSMLSDKQMELCIQQLSKLIDAIQADTGIDLHVKIHHKRFLKQASSSKAEQNVPEEQSQLCLESLLESQKKHEQPPVAPADPIIDLELARINSQSPDSGNVGEASTARVMPIISNHSAQRRQSETRIAPRKYIKFKKIGHLFKIDHRRHVAKFIYRGRMNPVRKLDSFRTTATTSPLNVDKSCIAEQRNSSETLKAKKRKLNETSTNDDNHDDLDDVDDGERHPSGKRHNQKRIELENLKDVSKAKKRKRSEVSINDEDDDVEHDVDDDVRQRTGKGNKEKRLNIETSSTSSLHSRDSPISLNADAPPSDILPTACSTVVSPPPSTPTNQNTSQVKKSIKNINAFNAERTSGYISALRDFDEDSNESNVVDDHESFDESPRRAGDKEKEELSDHGQASENNEEPTPKEILDSSNVTFRRQVMKIKSPTGSNENLYAVSVMNGSTVNSVCNAESIASYNDITAEEEALKQFEQDLFRPRELENKPTDEQFNINADESTPRSSDQRYTESPRDPIFGSCQRVRAGPLKTPNVPDVELHYEKVVKKPSLHTSRGRPRVNKRGKGYRPLYESTPMRRHKKPILSESRVPKLNESIGSTSIDGLSTISDIKHPISKFSKRPAITAITIPLFKTIKREYCILCSGMNEKQCDEVKLFVKSFNLKLTNVFSKDVTHVIVKTSSDDNNRACKTLKYLQGIAYRKWVLNFNWVRDSMLNRKILNEEVYEVVDSVSLIPGARKARLGEPGPFQGFVFLCVPPFINITVSVYEDLLRRTGATVVTTLEELAAAKTNLKIIAIQAEHHENSITEWHERTKAVPVAQDWIVDCVSQYRLCTLFGLLQNLSPQDVLDLGFPPELLEPGDIQLT